MSSHAPVTEDCLSDVTHAKLLSSRVQLHDGVWLVDDDIWLHDTLMVKLSVRFIYSYYDNFVGYFVLFFDAYD